MDKKRSKVKNDKKNKVIIGVILAVFIVAVIVVIAVTKTNSKGVEAQLDTEIWLNVGEIASLENGDDKITLTIDSDLNYVEGEEFEVPYVLNVNGSEYSGTYTFATGYSIHSEPNNIPYQVDFIGIEQGSVGVKITEK